MFIKIFLLFNLKKNKIINNKVHVFLINPVNIDKVVVLPAPFYPRRLL